VELTELAREAAQAIFLAFSHYHDAFQSITERASVSFDRCDWAGAQKDAVLRLELYKKSVDQLQADLLAILGPEKRDKDLWMVMRGLYSRLIAGRDDIEVAETFFNSATRRIFDTVGVDPSIEFVASGPRGAEKPVAALLRHYQGYASLSDWLGAILADYRFAFGYEDMRRDAFLCAIEVEKGLLAAGWSDLPDSIELVAPVFYRNKGAFLVGCLRAGEQCLPLVLALRNDGRGVYLDAVLTTENEVSILFSFTRSYFHVCVERPRELVRFLNAIMPLKRVDELYTSFGYNKHGKTEFYRDLLRHLAESEEQFHIAQGEKGMVMTVFTMPGYPVVFKIIKDRFASPKTTTRQLVMARYDLVFRHDRAGRLVDAQEFEHLQFARNRFSEALLAELASAATSSVEIRADTVVIHHLYTERRLHPLNLYIRDKSDEEARAALYDYGKAIKELAATNIFPGDLLLKNFGVTRHGRVVFYDYDELCLLTDCNFRRLPPARHDQDELDAEPWFSVSPNDIFPEEFESFLGVPEPLLDAFTTPHSDLFGVEFWRSLQERHRAGEIVDILPYPQRKRLRLQRLAA
jgi:isocitrate dehydrogenase kinase/phosphatase